MDEDLTRAERVERAAASWSGQLDDRGGPQSLQPGGAPDLTLDLTHAHPSGLAMLLAGRPTRLSGLVREVEALADARTRARAIRAATLEVAQERGLDVGWLAIGLATWAPTDGGPAPSAPVLLVACTLRPRGAAGEDFDVDLGTDTELNPVLLHRLATEHGIDLDADLVADLARGGAPGAEGLDPGPALRRVAQACSAVPHFTIEPRLVVGTLDLAAPARRADLTAAHDLAAHDVVAALAGDPGALAALAAATDPGSSRSPVAPPAPSGHEPLVLDVDTAQAAAVAAVRTGSHLVLQAPPGTGATQTVAALVAALAADGQRTLLVADKRAALDSVLQRLAEVGLGDLVLDLPDGGAGRRRIADALTAHLARADARVAASASAPADAAPANVDDLADQLAAHTRALHRVREPWGVTAYQAQCALAELTARRPAPRSRVRVRGEALAGLDRAELGRVREQLRAAAGIGVLATGPDDDPWFGARLTSAEQTEQALAAVTELVQHALPVAREWMRLLLDEAGMAPAPTVAAWGVTLSLVGAVRASLEVFSPAVFDTPLTDLVAATAGARWRAEHGIVQGSLLRRRLRRQARGLLRPGAPPADLHAALVAAGEQRERWQRAVGPGSRPALPSGLDETVRAYLDVAEPLARLSEQLAQTAAGGELADLDVDLLAGRLALLAERTPGLTLAPPTVALRERLRAAGLEPLLADLARRGVGQDQVGAELDLVWWTSLLEHVATGDPAYGAHDGERLRRTAAAYVDADRRQVSAGAARVRRLTTDRLRAALAAHPDQGALLRGEADRSRRHRPLRDLVRECSDVLLAAGPCWALSPLAVAQVLPPGVLFDVVVVLEASSVPVAEAVSAISRTRQVVLVGDRHQLPPSGGLASVLDAGSAVLPVLHLDRDHRSQDERLLAFADQQAYGGRLVTVPGAVGDDVLRLEQVEGTGPVPVGDEAVESTEAEVDRVIDLVVAHARRRPHESLGVVTVTRRHAARIQDALRRELAVQPDHATLAGFFADDRPEPFFVKDLERVQGDARDAVVLTIGFGRTPHGRVLHRFGPLTTDGGERRLTVATTRARRRMTVVSAFGADDLDPERLTAPGVRMLRDLLAHAAAGGPPAAAGAASTDPLMADLATRLRAQGLVVREGHGSSSGRIDLAVGVDDGNDRLLVAVEGDGPAYAAMATTRERDRLRVQHLQRLGWMHLRVWSTDVFRDPAREVARVRAAVHGAVRAAAPVLPPAPPASQTQQPPQPPAAPSARSRDDDHERWLLEQRPPHWD